MCLVIVEVPCVSAASPLVNIEWGQVTCKLVAEVINSQRAQHLVQGRIRFLQILSPHTPLGQRQKSRHEFCHLNFGLG